MDKNKDSWFGFFDGIRSTFKEEGAKRRTNNALLLRDLGFFALAFVFSRLHFVFGAYPFAIAFLAILQNGVWFSLFGAVAGAISLGKSGIIYAITATITVFLRIIVSGGGGERRLFSENLALKICSAGVATSVGGIYQILLDGFTQSSILFALFGLSLSCGFTVIFSGIYLTDITVGDIIFSKAPVFSRKNFNTDKEKFDLILFKGSLLTFIFLIGYALNSYELLGISLGYIYSAFLTLFTAKRFGIVRAVAVGFISSLSISGIYSAAFALVGLGAGALFAFGIPYAIIGGAILLVGFSYYVGGLEGIVSTFPEYMCASLLAIPALRSLQKENVEVERTAENDVAERMVNMAAMSYKNKETKFFEGEALKIVKTLSRVVHDAGKDEGRVGYETYRDSVVCDVREYCLSCPSYEACVSVSPAPCAENIDLIAEKLAKGERLFVDDINLFPKYCAHASELFDRIVRSAQRLENSAKKNRRMEIRAKDYELLYKVLDENFKLCENELLMNSQESQEIEKLLLEFGIGGPSVKIFGERRRHIVCAGVDAGGKISTSSELKSAIEDKLSIRLSEGEFYKKDKHILFEYDELEKYECNFAFSSSVKCRESVNGDSLVSFKSDDGRFYALLSDGEGSGQEARSISSFACDFLSRIFSTSISKSTAIQALNHILRFRENEKSATIDLFELDLYTGEASFYKCGASSSYIKRDGSIFRVRSQSAPIGLMSTIDAECIRVDVKRGDYIILLSDGVSSDYDDSTWLIELINGERVQDIKEYADLVLKSAKNKTGNIDDLSVAVIKVGLFSNAQNTQ